MIRGLPHKMAHTLAALENAELICNAPPEQFGRGMVPLKLSVQTCVSPEDVHPLWRDLLRPKKIGLRRPGYGFGAVYELRHCDGTPVNLGAVVTAGCGGESGPLLDATPPHSASSSGLVYVNSGGYYPSVFDLQWVAL